MSAKEFAEKYIKAQDEAIFNGNLSVLEELEDPNVTYHFLSHEVEMVGWEGHKQMILSIREAVSNFQHEWKYLTGEGNIFALSRKASGKITKEFPGFEAPIGKEYTAVSLMVFRLENEKIVEAWEDGSIHFV